MKEHDPTALRISACLSFSNISSSVDRLLGIQRATAEPERAAEAVEVARGGRMTYRAALSFDISIHSLQKRLSGIPQA